MALPANDEALMFAAVRTRYGAPDIDRTYPIEQIADAYRYVETGGKTGNVLISIEASAPDAARPAKTLPRPRRSSSSTCASPVSPGRTSTPDRRRLRKTLPPKQTCTLFSSSRRSPRHRGGSLADKEGGK